MIGRTCHVTRITWSRIDWLAGPKIRNVGLSFVELEMDKTVHLKLYFPLSGRSKHELFQFTAYWKINLISMDQQSGCEFKWRFSWWVSLCMVYFFNEIVKIYDQDNKALIKWLGGSVQEYIALVSMEKAAGDIFLHWPSIQLIRV